MEHKQQPSLSEGTIPAIDPGGGDAQDNFLKKNHVPSMTQSSSIQNSRQQLSLSGPSGSERWRGRSIYYFDTVHCC